MQILRRFPLIFRVLNGISQIMLQENPWTGFIVLVGIFWGNWVCGIATLLAALVGTCVAEFFNYNRRKIDAGLYGFSPALIGAALPIFFQASWLIWVFIVIGAVLACFLQHFFIRKNIPAYTFPFIFITWIIIFGLRHLHWGLPHENVAQSLILSRSMFWGGVIKGYAQVIFQDSFFTGIFFFVAVLLSSRRAAFYGIVASFLGAIIAYFFVTNAHESIYFGLYGFNAILAAIAFADEKPPNIYWAIIATCFAIAIHLMLAASGILNAFGGVLTFPFVAGTWLALLGRDVLLCRKTNIP